MHLLFEMIAQGAARSSPAAHTSTARFQPFVNSCILVWGWSLKPRRVCADSWVLFEGSSVLSHRTSAFLSPRLAQLVGDQPGLQEDQHLPCTQDLSIVSSKMTIVFGGDAWPKSTADQTKLVVLLRCCRDCCMPVLNIVSAVLVKPCLVKKQNKFLKRVREEGGVKQLPCWEGWVGSLSGRRSIVLVLGCQPAMWSCVWEAWVD